MANILGIDYYRIVCETGNEEWSQVYVKTAFDHEDLVSFGGVFGVMKLSGGGDLVNRGGNLISLIEEWCSEPKHKGDVSGILDLLTKNNSTGVFAWVMLANDGSRKIKVGALPGNGAGIVRGGKRVWLSENGQSKILVGELLENDKIFLGNKEALELIDQEISLADEEKMESLVDKVLAEMMNMDPGARAALVLTARPVEEKIGVEDKRQKQQEKEKLVGNRIVGVNGVAAKLAFASRAWRDLTLKWRNANQLPIQGEKEKKRKGFLLAGGVFLLILVVSVGFGLVKTRRDRAEASFGAVFESLEKKRIDAEALFGLNPVGARDMLRGVKEEVGAKRGQFMGTDFEERVIDFEKKVETSWEKVSGEQKTTLDLFFNLELIRSKMKGDRVAFDGKNLLVLDKTAGVVAKVGYPDKKQEVVLGKGEEQNWLDVAGVNPGDVLLLRTGLSAISSGNMGDLTFDDAVVDPAAVEMFGTAAYVLDKGASEIWRFGLSSGTIGERRRWLLPGIDVDLTAGVDLAIDTDVWIGLSNGKILRFRRGQQERFSLSDAPDGFKIDRIAVYGESSAVAALDQAGGRIVLFNKETGAYLKQIMAPELTAATDLVWVGDKEIMVLVGDKLFSVLP